MTSSPGPHVKIDFKEEMKKSYVEAYRSQFDEKEVSEETLVAAIKLLNRLEGGIEAHRDSGKLMVAIDHILNTTGKTDEEIVESLPVFKPSLEEFHDINRKKKGSKGEFLQSDDHISHQKRQKIISLEDEKKSLYKMIKTLEHEVMLERQKNQSLEHEVMLERQKNQSLEHEVMLERQKNQALEQDIVCLNAEKYNLLLENIAFEEKDLAEKQERECKICLTDEAKILFRPCNHIPACQGCFNNLHVNNDNDILCPICRSVMDGIIELGYS